MTSTPFDATDNAQPQGPGADPLVESVNQVFFAVSQTNEYLQSLYEGLNGMQSVLFERLDALEERQSTTIATASGDIDLGPVVDGYNRLVERVEALTSLVLNTPGVDLTAVTDEVRHIATVIAQNPPTPHVPEPDLSPVIAAVSELGTNLESRLERLAEPVVVDTAGVDQSAAASIQAIAATIDARLLDTESLVARFDARVAQLVDTITSRDNATIDTDQIVEELRSAIKEAIQTPSGENPEMARTRLQLAEVSAHLTGALSALAATVAEADDSNVEGPPEEQDAETAPEVGRLSLRPNAFQDSGEWNPGADPWSAWPSTSTEDPSPLLAPNHGE